MVSRCFPGGYNVKLYISRGRLAWWLLAFLCCDINNKSLSVLGFQLLLSIMSDSGQAVESQPLLGETNITAGGSSKWRSVMWVVAMVAVSVVIVLLIALPLTLVERPAELTNGTAGADVTTESPNTTDVPDATDLPEGLGTTDDEFVTEVVDVVTEEAQVVTAAAQVVQAVGAADVLLK